MDTLSFHDDMHAGKIRGRDLDKEKHTSTQRDCEALSLYIHTQFSVSKLIPLPTFSTSRGHCAPEIITAH